MAKTRIAIQKDDFDIGKEHLWLTQNNPKDGAVVTFVGLVRDRNQGNQVQGLSLEHYPGMTEKALANILLEVETRWQIGRVCVIHRVGELSLNDNIVFVGVSSMHRQTCFEACQFIMDFLKTEVPIWKKETSMGEQYWVVAKEDMAKTKQKWRAKDTSN